MPANEIINARTSDDAVAEIFESLQDWHNDRMEEIISLQKAEPLTVNIEGEKILTISGQDLLYFRLGLSVAEQMIGKFPLTIEKIDASENAEHGGCL